MKWLILLVMLTGCASAPRVLVKRDTCIPYVGTAFDNCEKVKDL